MLYKATVGFCFLGILVNTILFGVSESAAYDVPLLALIACISLWRLRLG